MPNPCVTHDSISLMITKSIRAVWDVETWVNRDSSSLLFYKSLGVFAQSTTCVTRDSSSLMFSKPRRAVWDVKSMGHP
jgi:hypothetical protein